MVILDPQWLADVMASIISFKCNYTQGILPHNSLSIIWKKYPESMHRTLFSILEKFEVVFPIRGQEKLNFIDRESIIPTMLPSHPTEAFKSFISKNSFERVTRLERTYKFDFMPLGFFSRLIVRLYHTLDLFCHSAYQGGVLISPACLMSRKMKPEEAVRQGFEQGAMRYHYSPSACILNFWVLKPNVRASPMARGEGGEGGEQLGGSMVSFFCACWTLWC